MKKTLTYLFLLSSVSVWAQFNISPRILTIQGANTAELYKTSVFTNNTTGTDTIYQWKMIERSLPMGWDWSFCDPKDCYNTVSFQTPYEFISKIGSNGIFKCDMLFNGISGTGILRFLVYSKANPTINDTITFMMNSWITGVKENTKSKELTFYPNPVKDQIFIKFNSKEAVTIDIYNVIGSKVKTFTHDAQQSVVNLGDLQNGMYFIRFTENGITYSKSFTKSE